MFLSVWGYSNFSNIDLDDTENWLGIAIQVSALVSLVFIAGAKEKQDDEMIKHMRLTSLLWAVLIHILLRLGFKLTAFYTKDPGWLPIGIQSNLLLIIYILLFHYQLYVREIILGLFTKTGSEK